MKFSKREIYSIPLFGYILHLIVAFFRLPRNDKLMKAVRYSVKSLEGKPQNSAGEMFTLTQFASITEIQSNDCRQPRIAFVSCLPPDGTGIATYSFHSLHGCDYPVDVFSPIADADYFYYNKYSLSSTSVQVFDVNALMYAAAKRNYDHIVFAIGNSDHHAYIFPALKKLRSAGMMEKVVFYVHDPVMLNITKWCFGGEERELSRAIRKTYKDVLGNSSDELAMSEGADWFVRYNIVGARILANLGVRKYLVNSDAAKRLLAGDLPKDETNIVKIFLPVFLPQEFQVAEAIPGIASSTIIVGTFGIPSNSKRTSAVVDACKIIAKSGQSVKLIIAGFGAESYVDCISHSESNLTVEGFGDLSDIQLLEVMSSVDVAVQLRHKNYGESSGVVAQLFALRKNVIVSDIGAFSEYAPAAMLVPANIKVEDLAERILSLRNDRSRVKAMEEYSSNRSPERFRCALLEALSAFSSSGRGEALNEPRVDSGLDHSQTHKHKAALESL